MDARSTYAHTDNLKYRLRQACQLLGVTDNTLRTYADNAGIQIKRANESNPRAVASRVFEPDTLFQLAQWRRAQGWSKAPAGQGPVIIVVDVVKGGTGKTTTAVETAVHLQFMGLRVLAIDLDVQANLTQAFGYEADILDDEIASYGVTQEAVINSTIDNLVTPFLQTSTRPSPSAADNSKIEGLIKKPFGEAGPHLIGANIDLANMETHIANSKGPREMCLRNLFDAATRGEISSLPLSNYDVVILDCPPNVSFTSTAALGAADLVIAPVRMDAFAIKGLIRLMGEIESIDATYKVRPELVILPTHYAPQIARIGRMQAKINQYKDLLAPNVISASEDFPKSLDQYLPLSLQRPSCTATSEYRMFAEFIQGKVLSISAKKGK